MFPIKVFRYYEPDGTQGGSPSDEPKTTPKMYSEEELKAAVAKRDAAKKEASELAKKVAEYEAAEKQRQEDKLKEEKRFEELLAQKEKEFEPLKSKAEQYDAFVTAKRETLKSKMGDKWMDEFSGLSLTALEKLEANFLIPKAVDTDNGQGEKPKTTMILTDAQKLEAKRMNLSENDYAEVMAYREKLKKKE